MLSTLCHCASCRRASAAPCVAWLTFDRGAFEFVSGKAQSFRSSADVVRCFCGACGSALTYENARTPRTIDVTTLSFDDPAFFPPTQEIWLEDKLPWSVTDPLRTHFLRGGQDDMILP